MKIDIKMDGKEASKVFEFVSANANAERDQWAGQLNHYVQHRAFAATAPTAASIVEARTSSRPTSSSSSKSSVPPSVVPSSPSPSASLSVSSSTAVPASSSSSSGRLIGANADIVGEARKRAALLARDKVLKGVYDELVVQSGTLTDEEFWENRAMELEAEAVRKQRVGISSAMAEAEVDDAQCNQRTVTITPNFVHSTFVAHPSVKRAYDANVPDKVSEEEFWKWFLKSQYIHSDAAATEVDRFFKKYDEEDEFAFEQEEQTPMNRILKELGKEKVRELVDPTVDLSLSYGSRPISAGTVSLVAAAGEHRDAVSQGSTSHMKRMRETAAAREVVRKYNRHASITIQGVGLGANVIPQVESSSPSSASASATANPATASSSASYLFSSPLRSEDGDGMSQSDAYHRKLADATKLEDLQNAVEKQYVQLQLRDQASYFGGDDVAVHAMEVDSGGMDGDALASDVPKTLAGQIELWRSERASRKRSAEAARLNADASSPVVDSFEELSNPESSYGALVSLSNLMQGMNRARAHSQARRLGGGQANAQENVVFSVAGSDDIVVPQSVQNELLDEYRACCELLRHFWSCFPVTFETMNKLERLAPAVSRFYDGLREKRHRLHARQKSALAPLRDPLERACLKAMDTKTRFDERFQERRKKQAAKNS